MIKILHIFPDDKFFDSVSSFFDSMNNIQNIYIYYSQSDNDFKYIKNSSKITRFYKRSDYTHFIHNADVDIIYLHSLRDTSIFKYFREDVKIIWWSWGFDIYDKPTPLSKPLINIELYKPLTKSIINKDKTYSLTKWLKLQLVKLLLDYRLKKAVARVDYFTPVLTNEYFLMKSIPFFKAKPFRIERGPGFGCIENLTYNENPGNILVGNSFTPSNNHLDVFKLISPYKFDNRKIIIPVNYGTGYPISINDLKASSNLNDEGVIWIEDFIPFDRYKHLIKSVTHAIFGHMRQQAVGNHSMCIRNGVKMFFYKDSINYKYYKDMGFIVYSLEDDLNEEQLSRNLSYEEALHNYELLRSITFNNKSKYEEDLNQIITGR